MHPPAPVGLQCWVIGATMASLPCKVPGRRRNWKWNIAKTEIEEKFKSAKKDKEFEEKELSLPIEITVLVQAIPGFELKNYDERSGRTLSWL